MKTTLIVVAALAFFAVVAPLTAVAEPCCGFGHCELVWYAYGEYTDPTTGEHKSIDAPGGYECVW